MKEPSAKPLRTLAVHERALRFSTAVHTSCPRYFTGKPSSVVWAQLVRASDTSSNSLIEAHAGSSDADFLSKMDIALREAKEARAALMKIRMGRLDNHATAATLDLESEASQLAAIYASIILNMKLRLEEEKRRADRQLKFS
ncbi:MAG: four helix bundle protein [Acidobacteriota bacterium]